MQEGAGETAPLPKPRCRADGRRRREAWPEADIYVGGVWLSMLTLWQVSPEPCNTQASHTEVLSSHHATIRLLAYSIGGSVWCVCVCVSLQACRMHSTSDTSPHARTHRTAACLIGKAWEIRCNVSQRSHGSEATRAG